MIVAERKPVEEICAMLSPHSRILVAGCRSCVAICLAGGEREVASLSEALRLYSDLNSMGWDIAEAMVERQCEAEWVDELAPMMEDRDAFLSMACGVGAQKVRERFPDIMIYPGLNTSNMGAPAEQGKWDERCGGCGDCVLHLTGGICPIARCAKGMLNGPCGGSQDGRCEISPDTPCAWQEIYDSLRRLGRLDLLEATVGPKDWRPSRSGGPRRIVKESAVLSEEERSWKR